MRELNGGLFGSFMVIIIICNLIDLNDKKRNCQRLVYYVIVSVIMITSLLLWSCLCYGDHVSVMMITSLLQWSHLCYHDHVSVTVITLGLVCFCRVISEISSLYATNTARLLMLYTPGRLKDTDSGMVDTCLAVIFTCFCVWLTQENPPPGFSEAWPVSWNSFNLEQRLTVAIIDWSYDWLKLWLTEAMIDWSYDWLKLWLTEAMIAVLHRHQWTGYTHICAHT